MKHKKGITIIGLLSAMHFLTDFLCAFTIYRLLNEGTIVKVVLYNFCAFALQLPLGYIADEVALKKKEQAALICVIAGVLLTALGCYTTMWVLGVGNALFHVGGGIITIHQDDENGFDGRGLGSFVAPGAIGLYLGAVLCDRGNAMAMTGIALLAVLCACTAVYVSNCDSVRIRHESYIDEDALMAIGLCLAVVTIRSFVGLTTVLNWKQGFVSGLLAVLCVAGGKTLGGFIAASTGYRRAVVASMLAAAVFYCFSDNMICGLLALLCFNMSMPVTLYVLAGKMRHLEGFAFGILTFGLFVGYYVHITLLKGQMISGYVAAALSLASLALLLPAIGKRGEER